MGDHHHDVIADLRKPTQSLRAQLPDVFAGFDQLHRSAVHPGALPTSIKEAAALAIAVVAGCDGCIAYHARAAALAGASLGEVSELLGVAVLMGGGPATVNAPRAWEAFLEFEGS
jgi:AhpD family alkylhydroperoxidase